MGLDWNFIVTVASLIVAIVSLLLTGEWMRIRGLLGLFKLGTRRVDAVVGVVTKRDQVLLVHRIPAKKSKLHWQFPAGSVNNHKPLHEVMIDEIKDETGIEVSIAGEIGRRVHPYTGRYCLYYNCLWVSGQEVNGDPQENLYVRWVAKGEVEAYLGKGLYSKVRQHLLK